MATVRRNVMHPKNIHIDDYTYDLPEERIASHPLPQRDASKLLIYEAGQIREDRYKHIDRYLPKGSLLVFNNTKVVEARLLFQKPTGGVIEIFCLEPHEQYPDITSAMAQKGFVLWKCLVGGASKWKRGQLLHKPISSGNQNILLTGRYIEKRTDHFIIELSWMPASLSFAELLHHAGAIPLPPYIKREPEESDRERYQTIYAQQDGSVAAPTAGLHFTGAIFDKLKRKHIETDYITLHVGAGTFRPVKSANIGEHEMHAEFIDISRPTLEHLLHHRDRPLVAVGTTSLRTLESLYWIGVKMLQSPKSEALPRLTQWEVYDELPQHVPVTEALQAVLDWMIQHGQDRLLTQTQIILAPGYHTRMISGLVTNFHQPGSTLLLLVAALIGEDWRKVYEYALSHEFRFLSYGDGCLIWTEKN
jgi:S-adenosylmethionine:tRNA ribosyltransferase-isomerase